MIIGGILVHACFWTGVYELTTKVVVPTIKAIIESVNETNHERREKK